MELPVAFIVITGVIILIIKIAEFAADVYKVKTAADVRKAEIAADVRKAEIAADAVVRCKAGVTGVRTPRCASSFVSEIKEARGGGVTVLVTHWERAVTRKVKVSSGTSSFSASTFSAQQPPFLSLDVFCESVREAFREELEAEQPFRLYLLPPNCDDLAQRVRVESDECLLSFFQASFPPAAGAISSSSSSSSLFPSIDFTGWAIYLWCHDERSPFKLPDAAALAVTTVMERQGEPT